MCIISTKNSNRSINELSASLNKTFSSFSVNAYPHDGLTLATGFTG